MASKENVGVKDTVGIVHTKFDGTVYQTDKDGVPQLTEEMLLKMLEAIKNDG